MGKGRRKQLILHHHEREQHCQKMDKPVFSGERWSSCEHVVHEGTKGPPVDRFAVAATCQYLWCHVLDCAAETEVK